MSDPDGEVPGLTVEDSPLNQSSAAIEFAASLSETFATWLAELRPTIHKKSLCLPSPPLKMHLCQANSDLKERLELGTEPRAVATGCQTQREKFRHNRSEFEL